MTKHIQQRRDAILYFIEEYSMRHGYSPTIREMADATGLASTAAVHHHLQAAVEEGTLTYQRGRMRTWKVTPRADR